MIGSPNTIERFWENVAVGQPDECWPFTLNADRDGYGRFQMRQQVWRAHRFAWWATHGRLERRMWVLHDCDNPPCCNPAHLHLGTAAKNNAERAARGRGATGDRHPLRQDPTRYRGERNPTAKLTAHQVEDIRARYAQGGIFQYQLGAEYGVDQGTIHKIVAGKSWAGANLKRSRLQETGVHGNAHEGNSSAKLTMAQANEIRALHAAGGISQSALGRRYGVSQATISRIVHGRGWR